jgi:hypothetical protein
LLSGEAFEHQPIFKKDLAFKHSLLVVREDNPVVSVYEELAAAGFSQEKLINLGCILRADGVGIIPIVLWSTEGMVCDLSFGVMLESLELSAHLAFAELENDSSHSLLG